MKKLVASLAIGLFWGLVSMGAVQAFPFIINTVDGDWMNAVPSVTISNSGLSGGLSTARWGTPVSGNQQSGYDFLSSAPVTAVANGTPFALGDFTHHNFPILLEPGRVLDRIDLALTISAPVFSISTTFKFDHDETPNTGPPPGCCNDLVTITNPIVNTPFTSGSQTYYFNLLGFSQDGGTTITTAFSTVEELTNRATLYAMITEKPVERVPEPTTMLFVSVGIAGLVGMRHIVKQRS